MLNKDIYFNFEYLSSGFDGIGVVQKGSIRLSGETFASRILYSEIKKISFETDGYILLKLISGEMIKINAPVTNSNFSSNDSIDAYDYIKAKMITEQPSNNKYFFTLKVKVNYNNDFIDMEFYENNILLLDKFHELATFSYTDIKNITFNQNILHLQLLDHKRLLKASFGKGKFIYQLWLNKTIKQ